MPTLHCVLPVLQRLDDYWGGANEKGDDIADTVRAVLQCMCMYISSFYSQWQVVIWDSGWLRWCCNGEHEPLSQPPFQMPPSTAMQ